MSPGGDRGTRPACWPPASLPAPRGSRPVAPAPAPHGPCRYADALSSRSPADRTVTSVIGAPAFAARLAATEIARSTAAPPSSGTMIRLCTIVSRSWSFSCFVTNEVRPRWARGYQGRRSRATRAVWRHGRRAGHRPACRAWSSVTPDQRGLIEGHAGRPVGPKGGRLGPLVLSGLQLAGDRRRRVRRGTAGRARREPSLCHRRT